jgi:hypothetical protein
MANEEFPENFFLFKYPKDMRNYLIEDVREIFPIKKQVALFGQPVFYIIRRYLSI